MRLTTRLLILTLLALLPTVTLSVILQIAERHEQQKQAATLALRQAALLDEDVARITETARTLFVGAQQLPNVVALNPACRDRLEVIGPELPAYVFLALFDRNGAVVCATSRAVDRAAAASPAWLRESLAASGFAIGRYATSPDIPKPFLPLSMHVESNDPARGPGLIMAGLDLDWLGAQLRAIKPLDQRLLAHGVLTVADRDGVVLARSAEQKSFLGHQFPKAVLPLVSGQEAGTTRLASLDGTYRVVGYIPTAQSRSRLIIAAGIYEPDLMEDLNRATLRGGLILAAVALGALLATFLAGRRFIGRPTADLVTAARRWREGNLGARAEVGEPRSEFGQIAAAFNDMAAAVEQRENELRQQADQLEARVADRTEELSKSYNRLQVEIAQRQQIEAALVQAQKLQTLGQLSGGVAHDFNNLLATILGTLELMGRSLGAGETRQRAMIERAAAAVQRGAQLTSRLLAFSRRRRLAVRPTDINRVITELAALLATTTQGKRIKLEMRLEPTLAPALAEPSQVEAAILNLAINARDAMQEGGMLTIATANVQLGQPTQSDDPPAGAYVEITVADTGEGMSEAVLRRAFDPFFTTKGAAGSGLGLSQVRGVSQELGGAVRIRSRPGAGTTITLLLPRARALPVPRERGRSPLRVGAWHVLLVEDDEAVLAVTGEMLRDLGCSLTEARDGCRALAALRAGRGTIDLVLADFALPDMSGLTLLERARAQDYRGPFVLATGYADFTVADLAGEAAPDLVLHKPFTMDEVEAAIARLQACTTA